MNYEDDDDREDKSATNSTVDAVTLLERKAIRDLYRDQTFESLGVKSAGSSRPAVTIVSFAA
jgi:hypothetical protein